MLIFYTLLDKMYRTIRTESVVKNMLYTDTEIGNIIRQKRTEAGLTQAELGAKLGVGKTAVAKWEAGKVKNLKRESLQQRAEIIRE